LTVAILGVVLAGTAVFVELQSSLNAIFGMTPGKKNSLLSSIRLRVISFVCVVGIGVLLLAAVITNTILSAVSSLFAKAFVIPSGILSAVDLVTQFGMVPVLLVLVYKLIPDRRMDWMAVLVGTMVTSVLFLAGKYVFGIYLTSSVLKSVYGAAGSLFLLLVWVYYSAQVFYFGAEVTKVYAIRHGSWGNESEQSAESLRSHANSR
jgi:membrane protein